MVLAVGNHDPATTDFNLRVFLRESKIAMLHDCGLTLGRLVILGRNDAISVREPDCRRPLQMVASGYQHDRTVVVVLILCAAFKLAGIAVQFHIDAGSNLVIRVRGQPLRENLLVQALERLGHPAVQGITAQVWAGMVRVVKPAGTSLAGS